MKWKEKSKGLNWIELNQKKKKKIYAHIFILITINSRRKQVGITLSKIYKEILCS